LRWNGRWNAASWAKVRLGYYSWSLQTGLCVVTQLAAVPLPLPISRAFATAAFFLIARTVWFRRLNKLDKYQKL
jgi:hypothetical protein